MRILAVSHTPVWPVRSGAANRRLMTLHALASFGTVDLLYTGEVEHWASVTPADAPVAKVWEAPVGRTRPSMLARSLWLIRPRLPLQVLEWANHHPPEIPGQPYDVVWYFQALTHSLAQDLQGKVKVVDLNDLEDDKLRLARALGRKRGSARTRLAEHRNTSAWRRYQHTIADRVNAVTVCSEADRRTLSVDNCHVVPNGFPAVEPVVGSAEHRPSTLLLVGLFDYDPNADGAEFFVSEVFPAVRSAISNSTLRLVGRDSPRVRRLSGEGISVVGEVDDLAPEYEHASVAIAPVRFGSGTRVKILEAFARRVPVVSTTIGAAGLGAVDGEHLLLSDDAASFADACISLMTDAGLRRRLTTNAHCLYESRFGQSAITRSVGKVLYAAGCGPVEAGPDAGAGGCGSHWGISDHPRL